MSDSNDERRWSVVVVEDNPLTCEFLGSCINAHPQLELAASFATLASARSWFKRRQADLLLVDLGLPDGSGLTLMREVHSRWPQCDMLVVSMFGDEVNVVASIEAGAVGYVHKDDEAADIAETLLAVKGGASPISPMIARHLLLRMRPSVPEPAAAAVSLSPREQEVLQHIARGLAYAEIARLQGVTVHTVQTHIKKLYGKLAVHSRSEAVFEANRLGLLNDTLRR
ncbi:response regulator [Aquabacterium sp.]|uniref:response regulator n=1 Tax=Aquabacterium sp. TaxID=1872578 RepID=UPI003D6CD3DA